MKINIKSPGFKETQELTDFINSKVTKLFQYFDKIISSEVSLSLDRADSRENKVCNIRLVIPGNDLQASAQCRTFEEAVVLTTESLERQIQKRKTKLTSNRP